MTLPAQPTSGTVERVPLGGDGFRAPNAAYAIIDHSVTGDGIAGSEGLTIVMDDRFCSLVAWITVEIAQTISADADVRFTISDAVGRTPRLLEQRLVVSTSLDLSSQTIGATYNPTPQILGGGPLTTFCSVASVNVADDVVRMSAMIYLFDIRVREKTPMGPLLWARGAT